MYFKRFLATNNKYISVIAHSIKSVPSTSNNTKAMQKYNNSQYNQQTQITKLVILK